MRKAPISLAQKGIPALLCVVCAVSFSSLIFKTSQDIHKFIEAKGQYAFLKDAYPAFRTAREIKHILPSDTTVTLIYRKLSIESIALQYALYPIKVGKESPFLVDLDGSFKNPPPGWGKAMLSTGAVLYDREGYRLPKIFHPTPHFSRGRVLVIFLMTALCHAVIGFMLFPFNPGRRGQPPYPWLYSLYYVSGVIACTVFTWALLLAGMPLGIRTLALGSAVMALFFLFSHRNREPFPLPDRTHSDKAASIIKTFFFFCFALVILTILSTPVRDWDTMATWLIKSKIIAHQKNLDLVYTSGNHNYYPILWPLHIAIQYVLSRGIFDEMAVWSSALTVGCFFIFLYHALRLLKVPSKGAWLSLTVFTCLFITENPFTSALPENMFLAILTGLIAVVLLWFEFPGNRKLKCLILLLSLGLNLTKLEGSLATLFLIASIAGALYAHRSPLNAKGLLTALAGTTIFPFLWVVWIKCSGLSPIMTHFRDPIRLGKLVLIIQKGWWHFAQNGEMLIFLLVFLTFRFFPNSRKWNASETFLLLFTFFLIGFRWIAFVGWSETLINNEGVFPDACSRLFLHAAPSLSLLWASRIFHRTG